MIKNRVGPLIAVILSMHPSAHLCHAAGTLKFSETLRGSADNFSATVTVPLVPGGSIDASTPFDFTLGGFEFRAVLGDDRSYKGSATKADFVTRGNRTAPVTHIELAWRRGTLTVSVAAHNLDVPDLADDFVTEATALPGSITFGNTTGQFSVTFRRTFGRNGKISRGQALVSTSVPSGALAAAKFDVDLPTSQVTVTSLQAGPSPAVVKSGPSPLISFQGSTVLFNSSTLLDQPGDTGVKVLNVSLSNNFALPIGVTPDGTVTGLKVLFGGFTNVGAFSDPRPRTIVTTAAGTGVAGAQDGAAATATFNALRSVAIGSDGSVYVADYLNNKVRKIDGNLVSTLAGSGTGTSIDGSGKAASLNGPWGIAVDPVDGALIVTEFTGNRIRRIAPDGVVTTIAGTGSAGGANGSGTAATFNAPTGIAVDASGGIYVSEYLGQRIRKITLATGADPRLAASYTVATLAGSGSAGFADGIGAAALFNSPMELALLDGAIYVADSVNDRIRRVSATGEVVTIAGNGTASETNGGGDTATFNIPRGIAAAGESLLVSDQVGNTIRQLTLKASSASPGIPGNWLVVTLAGTGSAGAADGRGNVATFNSPNFIATDASRNVYVADSSNNKVREITPALGYFPVGVPNGSSNAEPVQLSNADGVIPSSAAGIGLPYVDYAGQLATGASTAPQDWNFIVPTGVSAFEFNVTVEAATTAFEPPFAALSAGSPNNDVRTLAGSFAAFGFTNGAGAVARFEGASSICSDAAGNVYVADTSGATIRRVSNQGVVTPVAGLPGRYGTMDGSGDVATFSSPYGIAATPDGRTLFVTEFSTNVIRRLVLLPVPGSDPAVYDPTNPEYWSVNTIAGYPGATGLGFADGTGDIARFNEPLAITVDPSGLVYITEEAGERVRRVQYLGGDPTIEQDWYVTTVAGDTTNVYGAAGTTNGTGSAARFFLPIGIAADSTGNLYVADYVSSLIRKITNPTDAGGGAVTTIAGSTPGYADGAGSNAKFNSPNGIACDSAGYLWVADLDNYRVRRISPADIVETVAGNGSNIGYDGPGNSASLRSPLALSLDASGNLYLLDASTRIVLIQRVLTTGSP